MNHYIKSYDKKKKRLYIWLLVPLASFRLLSTQLKKLFVTNQNAKKENNNKIISQK